MVAYEWVNEDVEMDPRDRLIRRTKLTTHTEKVTMSLRNKEQRLVNLQAELVELEEEIKQIKLQLDINILS